MVEYRRTGNETRQDALSGGQGLMSGCSLASSFDQNRSRFFV